MHRYGLHTLAALERSWRDAVATREECAEELANAQSMRNRKRISECERWLTEAQDYEAQALKKMQQARERAATTPERTAPK